MVVGSVVLIFAAVENSLKSINIFNGDNILHEGHTCEFQKLAHGSTVDEMSSPPLSGHNQIVYGQDANLKPKKPWTTQRTDL